MPTKNPEMLQQDAFCEQAAKCAHFAVSAECDAMGSTGEL